MSQPESPGDAPGAATTATVRYIPMQVDAFILNEALVSPTRQYTVSPLNRPDYAALKPGPAHLRHDFVPPVVVKSGSLPSQNQRLEYVRNPAVRKARAGVYLHWCVPHDFRVGRAKTHPQTEMAGNSGDGEAGKITVSASCQV